MSLSLSDVDDDLDSPYDRTSPSTASSTPDPNRRLCLPTTETTPSSRRTQCSPYSNQPSAVLGVLQEQQCILQKVLQEQQEIMRTLKRNEKRIALIETQLKQNAESSCSANEKKRTVTKDLTVITLLLISILTILL